MEIIDYGAISGRGICFLRGERYYASLNDDDIKVVWKLNRHGKFRWYWRYLDCHYMPGYCENSKTKKSVEAFLQFVNMLEFDYNFLLNPFKY